MLLHLIPAVLFSVFFIIWGGPRQEIIPSSYHNFEVTGFQDYLFRYGTGFALFAAVVYLGILLGKSLSSLKKSGSRKEPIQFVFFSAIFEGWLILLLGLYQIKDCFVIFVFRILAVIFAVVLFFFHNRYSHFFLSLQSRLKGQYAKSQIENIDVNAVLIRLDKKMKSERLYQDYELTLKSLAGEVGVTPHQLSEILNNKIGDSFYGYINKLRVEESKILLMDNPDESILDVALDVGFNSLSAFYRVFNKIMGLPPSDYRKKMVENKQAESGKNSG